MGFVVPEYGLAGVGGQTQWSGDARKLMLMAKE